jgi:hypothetical protein
VPHITEQQTMIADILSDGADYKESNKAAEDVFGWSAYD